MEHRGLGGERGAGQPDLRPGAPRPGITGVLDNVLAGGLFAILYFASGRNLWLPILAHGLIDTTSVVLLYLGIQP